MVSILRQENKGLLLFIPDRPSHSGKAGVYGSGKMRRVRNPLG